MKTKKRRQKEEKQCDVYPMARRKKAGRSVPRKPLRR